MEIKLKIISTNVYALHKILFSLAEIHKIWSYNFEDECRLANRWDTPHSLRFLIIDYGE